MSAENINNHEDLAPSQSVTALRNFKALLAAHIPLTVSIDDVTYAVADLTDEEIIFYDKFVRENYNHIIDGLEQATNEQINDCMDNPERAVYNTYLYFKSMKRKLLYYLEMIEYALNVHICNEPLRAERFDSRYEEWYPSDELEPPYKDASSCLDNPDYEDISVEVREMAWYGLLQAIGPLYGNASASYYQGYRMVYNR